MNYLNGGYVMLDKADSNIFAKASGALKAGKPILWYEDKNTCYYIDTISKSGDDIVLTKGGKTITITSANVVTESGNVQTHLYQHTIKIVTSDYNDVSIIINNTSNDSIDTLEKLLIAMGDVRYNANGFEGTYGDNGAIALFVAKDESDISIYSINLQTSEIVSDNYSEATVTDTVTQLI